MIKKTFAFMLLVTSLASLSGCWDENQKIVCDEKCRAERSGGDARSGEANFPSLDTSAPDSFKKAPKQGQ
ncbi:MULTISPECIES: hypothetical protein [Pseudomonas syringae group]|uniref:Lipoprotein n=1 Tax=Pseudomonas savastanoi pv. glycinea TaxID=318 RepID=A0A3M3G4F6_PSESG|nr:MULTISPECIES: hypothetical protein [Pseudomonas syringae group]RMM69121.1 hypothetical protein ALQ73_200239 [Pseudomonas savastanoi pv. glycinea]